MRKLALALAVLSTLVLAGLASAHPLGNFTTNRYSRLELSGDRIYVLYVLDLAEIPTYQARDELERLGKRSYAAELADRLGRGIRLRVDGDLRRVTPLRRAIAFPKGVGGLDTTRLEIVYDGGAAPAAGPVSFAYEDSNFPNRIGWREVVVSADGGSRIETSTAPATSVSDELRAYPKDRLASPLDVTGARATYRPGTEQGTPPRLLDPGELSAPARVASQSERGFASLVTKRDLGAGVILVSLLAAMFWGAAHALTPGHGKAIVAAYMVGSRGTARHALLLGGIVTVTHTIGVFTLGGVTLALSEFIVPETLYPWLNLVSALLVVVVGVTVLRLRLLDWLRPWRPLARQRPRPPSPRGPRAPAPARRRHEHEHATTTATATPRPRHARAWPRPRPRAPAEARERPPWARRHRRLGWAPSVPDGSRRPPRRDLPSPRRLRPRSHRCVQPRPGGSDQRHRAPCGRREERLLAPELRGSARPRAAGDQRRCDHRARPRDDGTDPPDADVIRPHGGDGIDRG
jgi:hypothetical protein